MSFLNLKDKKFLVVGVANRKSVAWTVAKILEEEGADVIYCVRSEKRREELSKLIAAKRKIFVCDFEKQKDIEKLGKASASCPIFN